jgi:hypothetical protein
MDGIAFELFARGAVDRLTARVQAAQTVTLPHLSVQAHTSVIVTGLCFCYVSDCLVYVKAIFAVVRRRPWKELSLRTLSFRSTSFR